MSPVAIVKSSAAFTVLDEVSAPFHRWLPAVEASHSEIWVSVPPELRFVHVVAASVVIVPPDAAAHDVTILVVSANALDVPASPGSPVWSFA